MSRAARRQSCGQRCGRVTVLVRLVLAGMLAGMLVMALGLGQPGALLAQDATVAPAGETATPPRTPNDAASGTGATAGLSLGKAAVLPTIGKTKTGAGAVDYAAWEKMAERAEAALTVGSLTASETLVRQRSQLADWREVFLGAENANAARIETLRLQISALGPVPVDGEGEALEIGKRRVELSDQLVRLQAPGIAAEEAYRRADGLIAEIDRVLRERQADELLKLSPSPLNPANWTTGLAGLGRPVLTIWSETARRIADPAAVGAFLDSLPLVIVYLVLALGLLWRGQRGLARLIGMLRGPVSPRAHRIWDFLASLTLALVPVAGLTMLSLAFRESGLFGPLGLTVFGGLGRLGFVAVAAHWLGSRAFPAGQDTGLPLGLSDEQKAQARFVTTAFGILIAVGRLRRNLADQLDLGDAATAVTIFPFLLAGGLLLWRLGRILGNRRRDDVVTSEEVRFNYRDRSIAVLARATTAIGLAGPVLAAVGYIAAAQALLFPAGLSLALVAMLVLVQRLIADVSALVTRAEGPEQDGLVPVLAGFALSLATLPVFALIWGARPSDLTEIWTRFQQGFQLGQTRISPTEFLVFAVIFGIGLTVTRLVQGALKASVLPRTGMDQGGQNAIVAGLGYGGIFLSALVAIDSTGIDLSGLAIVAGALSVGIGFGLQTIVSNFVSGVILLIERPVSEGDWIEVGPVQGIVKAISVRSTRIQTFDRSDVIVPNSDLITGRVTNWTRFNLTGRLVVPVTVPLTSDGRRIEAILREIAEAQPMVLLSPPPVVALVGIAGDVMSFEIRVILRDVNFQLHVRSEINQQIVERFAALGIAFSNAHRDHLAGLAEGPAVEAAAKAEVRAQDALLAALMGPAVAAQVKGAREGEVESGGAA